MLEALKELFQLRVILKINEFNGNKLSVEELSNDFEISEGKNTLSIKALLNYNNLGKVIKIIATLPNKQPSSIELEVMR